ncbi:hypothetical protein COLO4_26284 [Corchorus olitorius]|uniref:Uncharacterized protein n=1 Tax=Corchorus olitorius TaxID=93759 RepID=A0A1R3HXX9_9ROSI|nr:hypothetical protein COLO4_26284 [Corchorus olitorius]
MSESGRILVVIFFFWAALTLITPTLVQWSESAKAANLELNGDQGIKDRKMIGYGAKQVSNDVTISSTRSEAVAKTEQQSWLHELECRVSKVIRKAMGMLITIS